MLSYRHAFHAGNFADVFKHLVLVKSLEYLLQKPGPLLYIDTHAGAGSYPLNNAMSRKTNEYAQGAGALQLQQLPADFAPYGRLVERYGKQGIYPGSPLIAADLLRDQDKLRLFELHPTDYPKLARLFAKDRRVRAEQSDGHHALKSQLPAAQKRALVLMDPAYEVKREYQTVVDSLLAGYKRMANATYLLWYPVVQRDWIDRLVRQLRTSNMKDIWQFELGLEADNREHGMTASGMIAINPPWVLPRQMADLLPALQRQLASDRGFYRIEQIGAG
ncbi:23S rRNA (adenine(2030)-N(6))-methyltransferase RlmJ [Sedimenticola selenatireducens]|uniref:Ribosomal RNA large subunit methyltransferase J n=1 Tax=Sedimenticola selenatireducens TaxID=191960 RepID=A0A2N6CY27_9GAMM|nr:23S rRNA (adenine(2030)-N(6))-methyltransferase RlmJ [Sedimenticola selenatireducens]PLX62220.1 MAG: 23S rRNA (adenine(2030)-N(6))-methyltransferase RlmJ [Sedimenticola selenatireducens]